MDPLSIAASAVALTQAAGVIASSLAGFVRSLQTADARITALRHELANLTAFLQSVEKTLNGCHKFDFALIEEDLWQQSHIAMADCKSTLGELASLVNKINHTAKPKGLVWKTRAVIDLNVHGVDIAAFRDKIQQSNWALQTVLHTMTVSLSFRQHTSQETIIAKLSQLKASIDETLHASSRPAGGFERGVSDHPDSRIARNMRHLAQAAGHFYSAASSTASSTRGDRSIGHTTSYQSAAAASILGDFPDSRRERVEQFLHDSRNQLRDPTILSIPSQTSPSWNSSSRYSRPPSLFPSTMSTALARGSSNRTLDDDDVDAEFERLYLDGLQELATTSMKNRDYQIAIEYLQQALQRDEDSGSGSPESHQRQIQLAFCYFFLGTWRLAEPIVTKLAQLKSDQDLAVCSLLHALSLAYLSEYLFDDALATCKKALPGKKRLCHANGAKWQEYREALALLATIFHMEGDYFRAEVLRRQLPTDFVYVHPANAIQYLQSKSDVFESMLGDDDPHQGGMAELDGGQNLAAEGQRQGVARNGTVTSSRGASLRAKVLENQRYEMDTMKEVVFVEPAEPQSATDADDEASIFAPVKGSLLRRRLTQLFGSKQIRKPSSDEALAAVQVPESPISDTASVVLPAPESQYPNGDGIWLKIKKSKTLLRKRSRPRVVKFPLNKAGDGQKEAFRLINMERISYPQHQQPAHQYNPGDYSYVPSENDSLSPIVEVSDPLSSTTINQGVPTEGPESRPSSVSPCTPETDELDPTVDTRAQPLLAELADENIGTPSISNPDFNADQPQTMSSSGPGNPGDARAGHEIMGSGQTNNHSEIPIQPTKVPLPTISEDLEKTPTEVTVVLTSLPAIADTEELHSNKLDLEILLQKLQARSDCQVLLRDLRKIIRDLEQRDELEYEEAHDSGYETMDDSRELVKPAPEPSKGHGNDSTPISPNLRRAFSWTMGSEASYTAHESELQPTDEERRPADTPPWLESYNAVAIAFKRQNSGHAEDREETQSVSDTELEPGIGNVRREEGGSVALSIPRLEARASWDWDRL
ncbi:hypothetical protein EDB80DRAFT_207950 [Ilyonectria destructans]|nr:hypothetical protein EDB80DRAFT_207950 [Ilyonectria destructans]